MTGMTDLSLRTPTLALLERACHLLETPGGEAVHLDDLLAGDAEPVLPDGAEGDLLRLLSEEDVSDEFRKQAARHAAQAWMQAALEQIARAGDRAHHYAERCAVASVMKQQDGSTSLARAVARFEADAYHRLWHEMELEDALAYLMTRAVDHVSRNLEDYL